MIKNFDSIEEFKDKKSTKKENKVIKDIKDLLFSPKIGVLGVGGAGTNAINNLIKMNLTNVKFLVANTDIKSLEASPCNNKIRLGIEITKGLGAGSNPEIGFKAAESSKSEIAKALEGIDLLFLLAGMGGGTGTGATPLIAQIAKDLDILTLGFVTKPFKFEGKQRIEYAAQGLKELEKHIDSIIIMSNQNLFKIIHENTSMLEAFRITDNVIYSGIKAISDLITANGMVNLDFNDIKCIIQNGGKAVVTSAEVTGKDKVNKITDTIINNPLIDDDISIINAKNILISIAGGLNMTLFEVDKIINGLRNKANRSTYINFGAIFDETMNENVRVSVIATGIYNNGSAENFVDDSKLNSKDSVNKSLMNNVLKEELVQKEKIEENAAKLALDTTEQSDNSGSGVNPFNKVSNNNFNNYPILPDNEVNSESKLKEEETYSVNKVDNHSSLFNLIEKQKKDENIPTTESNSFSTDGRIKETTHELNKNKTTKSFFEIPPFLRNKK